MKSIRSFLLAIAAVSLCVSTVFCQEKNVSKKINGTVSQVAFAQSFIVVTCELGYLKFKVPDDTVIIGGKNKIDLSDIRPEDSVTVRYDEDADGTKMAVEIRDSSYRDRYF